MIIYKITNTINNKVYIGQTIRALEKRWVAHCRKGSECPAISRAIQKHGRENFTIEEIDRAETLELLNEKEIYWIKWYNSTDRKSGYNLSYGGSNSSPTEETRKKIGAHFKGKKISKETIEAMKKGKKLKGYTEENKKNVTISQRKRRIEELKNNDMAFINKWKDRWVVKVFKQYIGQAKTIEKCKEIRDEYLKTLDEENLEVKPKRNKKFQIDLNKTPNYGLYEYKNYWGIKINGTYLGRYKTIDEARKVRDEYVIKNFSDRLVKTLDNPIENNIESTQENKRDNNA